MDSSALMTVQAELEPVVEQTPRWGLVSKVAFRFCVVYFGLFCLMTQIVGALLAYPSLDLPDPSSLWPMRQTVFWAAKHIFGVTEPLVYTGSGSGDKIFDWVLCFCLLVMAALGAAVWSFLDRRRTRYTTSYNWFRVLLRFALASQMLTYGMVKAIPLQMPFPSLMRLLEPYGNFSPMGVLWYSIGASPVYEIFTGCAELLGGILLILPRTTTIGALICLADAIEVFTLNMTYDVPVKLFSFHLIVMALLLLGPNLRRIADFFFMGRSVQTAAEPRLFSTGRANRIAVTAQVVFGLWLLAMNAYGGWTSWKQYGGGSPKSPLYGIWNVDQLTGDGEHWRRVIFDAPNYMAFQRMDDTFVFYGSALNLKTGTLALTKSKDKKSNAALTFQRPAKDRLILDGEMDGHKINMQLRLVDHSKFQLLSRGFHWVQEYPYNR